jgi:transketolase
MDIKKLEDIARLVRYYILFSSTTAGSGHPTSSLSATDLMVALFFNKLRFDLDSIDNPNNDRVIFSKGHASPLFYSIYLASGVLSEEDLNSYRKFGSNLEGHPRPNFKFAEAATGSLGQGLSIGLGMAMSAKLDGLSFNTYVLMGDSEVAEGSIWEAVEIASYYKLGNLVGIVDVNRLGQRGETMLGYDVDSYKRRFESFGWEVYVIDGHNLDEIVKTLDLLDRDNDRPKMIVAKTIKGKGVSFLENKDGWHGKALSLEDFEKAVKELGEVDKDLRGDIEKPDEVKSQSSKIKNTNQDSKVDYKIGDKVATRKAYGEALADLGYENLNVVSLDGETSNSTYSEIFKEAHTERFFEMFIAEQNMVGAALGFSKRGKVPFVSTFSAFFTRAFDQIRMSAYSEANIKLVGSHSGVSIGEDGPSQMGLEDISMFRSVINSVVLCPSDAVSTSKLVKIAASKKGIFYIRTARPETPVIYSESEDFKVGGSKVVVSGEDDQVTVVACGVALHEAIKAAEELSGKGIGIRVIDVYSIKPIDEVGIKKAVLETRNKVISVEDHYFEGGLGDAVLNIFSSESSVQVYKLAVCKMPMSGKGSELLDYEGISASGIIGKVKELIS